MTSPTAVNRPILVLDSAQALRLWRKSVRDSGNPKVGFVPTMGALHEGHLSLVKKALAECEQVVVSIFVNPLQFGPNEDFSRYPRTWEKDLELLSKVPVSAGGREGHRPIAVFAPTAEDLYPSGASTYVVEEMVSQPLCGEFRPGHFRGVATVVLKLFNLVQPEIAYFGQKDAQQCAVIERMVRDLNVPVRIVRGETVREADGLAMSSRNRYLSADERKKAARIYESLEAARQAAMAGERNCEVLERIGRSVLEREPDFRIQYWEARDPETLKRIPEVGGRGVVFAVGGYLGRTRLIDNLELAPQPMKHER